jgi:hypothetical protein
MRGLDPRDFSGFLIGTDDVCVICAVLAKKYLVFSTIDMSLQQIDKICQAPVHIFLGTHHARTAGVTRT